MHIRPHSIYRPLPVTILDPDFADVFDATEVDGVWIVRDMPCRLDATAAPLWLN